MKLTMSNWVLSFFALCVIALNPAHAQTGATTAKSSEARSAAKIPIQQFKLKNGLRVVLSEDHSAPTYSICVTYDVGSRGEPAGHRSEEHTSELQSLRHL